MSSTFNLRDVNCVYAGIVMSGYGNNGGIEIQWDSDIWEAVVGADGEETRVRTNNDGANAVVTLMQSSSVNDLLAGILIIDNLTGNQKLPFILTDAGGTSRYQTSESYLLNRPNANFARTVSEREWRIRMVPPIDHFTGGNFT